MFSPNTLVVRSEDQRFASDESNVEYSNHLFVRLVAKDKTFSKVDFKYCVFDSCYLRRCKFSNCDFTGAKFVSTSFHGSSFTSCQFAYATFEKTQIAPDILETQAPDHENQKARFARSLRTNYQQLGDAEAVNKAIKIELEATKTHLYEAWHSPKDYYRKKYRGGRRAQAWLNWAWFTLLHFLWGNGESAVLMLRSILFLFFGMAIYHALSVGDASRLTSYWQGFWVAPEVYLGVTSFPQYSAAYLATIAAFRLLTFAALTSILINSLWCKS